MSERLEKSWSAVLVAARTHHNSLVDEGAIDEDRVRLTIAARVAEVKELTTPIAEGGKGLSQRQAAKVLGVSHTTVQQDLADKLPENGNKVATEGKADGEKKSSDQETKTAAIEGAAKEDVADHTEPMVVEQPARETFETIIIDPPWPMTKIERDVRPNQTDKRTGDVFDYPTMDEAELRAFANVIKSLSADDCHLFMWTTQKHLPLSMKLIDAYGFKYVLAMVWHKPGGYQPTGLPQFNCEFVIYGRKGTPKFVDTKGFPCCFNAPRREHSRKPDEFYDIVSLVTKGPRIDVFSRESREGFAQFGNETGKFEAA